MSNGKPNADQIDPLWSEELSKGLKPVFAGMNEGLRGCDVPGSLPVMNCPRCNRPNSAISCSHGEHLCTDCSLHDTIMACIVQWQYEKRIRRKMRIDWELVDGKMVAKGTSYYQSRDTEARGIWYYVKGHQLQDVLLLGPYTSKMMCKWINYYKKFYPQIASGIHREFQKIVNDEILTFPQDLVPQEENRELRLKLNTM